MDSPDKAVYPSPPASTNLRDDLDDFFGAVAPMHDAPILTLFSSDTAPTLHPINVANDEYRATDLLKSGSTRGIDASSKRLQGLCPSLQDLQTLMTNSRYPKESWKNIFPGILPAHPEPLLACHVETLADKITSALYNDHTCFAARTYIGIALTIRHLPTAFDWSRTQLGLPPADLRSKLILSAEAALLSPSCHDGCHDKLESRLMLAKYYIETAKPFKAWQIIRQAVSQAYVLGLHKPGPSIPRLLAVWADVWQTERHLSLLLGLPSCVLDIHVRHESRIIESEGQMRLAWALGEISGCIIDRNTCPGEVVYDQTLDIDRRLQAVKAMLPAEWWTASTPVAMRPSDVQQANTLKFRFHVLLKLLHLPHFVQGMEDENYEYSRRRALSASRSLIRIYQTMRHMVQPAVPISDLMDYEVFTAALILLINLIQQPRELEALQEEDKCDWQYIFTTISELKCVAATTGCKVASQGSQVLEDLIRVHSTNEIRHRSPFTIVIPYFGRLSIKLPQCHEVPEESSNAPTDASDASPQQPSTPLVVSSSSFDYFDGSTCNTGISSAESFDFQPWQDLNTELTDLLEMDMVIDWQFPSADVDPMR
ncbi:hypothetical protein B9Z65_1377 [Elsinoe australis]|uniref:Xylanolytic transcriptional activator regulatory domain-containing protein n=1 Tax=Elsinoe australis TaxID=40998 RepID=A0A2P7YFR8_9PEZI|nr:hypothetical protein B9Z65_1377 [Elsinoe australis]